jgi:hypothetical protein
MEPPNNRLKADGGFAAKCTARRRQQSSGLFVGFLLIRRRSLAGALGALLNNKLREG